MPQQEITSEEMFGIAKKFNRELEAFPLHTHSAIVEMVRCGMQHRQLAMQHAAAQEQKDQQERIIRLKEFEMQQVEKRQAPAIHEVKPPDGEVLKQ